MQRVSWSLAALLLSGVATDAVAQTEVARDPAPVAEKTAPVAASVGSDIVITGSRISRKDYVAESPITTVSADVLKSSGTPQLEETINFMPQFTAASTGQTRQVNGSAPGAGRSTTNLRGLGTSRTLVLLDGRRMQPADEFNVVDINTVPTALLQGVEIITGGASAVYGSDAIAGVVNYKTKQNFTGIELDTDLGISELGDAKYANVSLLGGKNFGEGNNVVLGVTYYNREGARLGKREWFKPTNITSTGPDGQVLANSGITQAALNTLFITRYGLGRAPLPADILSVNPDGTLYSRGNASNTVNCKSHAGIGDNASYVFNPFLTPNECDALSNNSALLPLERVNVFARARYAVTDNIDAFVQANFFDSKTTQTQPGANISSTLFRVFPTNVTIPADLRFLLAQRANPNASFLYQVRTNKVGIQRFTQKNQTWQVIGGFQGKAFGDWTWEAYAGTGETDSTETGTNLINIAAFANLLAAPDAGNSICAGGWNLFDTQAPLSDACRAYVARDFKSRNFFKQDLASAQAQGTLFNWWAGSVKGAVGAEYRKYRYEKNPDFQLQTGQLTSGSIQPSLPGSGSQDVKEVFAEVLIPLLRDIPLVHELSADLAARHSDYSTSGGVDTWKASGLWNITRDILVRGSKQQAIRAPSVGDLFLGATASPGQLGAIAAGGGDPCAFNHPARATSAAAQIQALCIAQGVPAAVFPTFAPGGTSFQQISAGNPDLTPEKSRSETLGVAIQTRFLPGALSRISMSVDYFNIRLNNAIGSVSGPQQVQTCFNLNGENPTFNPMHPTCLTIHRLSTGSIDSIDAFAQNLFKYQTAGFDFQFDWRLNASDFGLSQGLGSLALNVSVSKVTKYLVQKAPGQAPLDLNGTVSGNNQGAISSSPSDSESWSHPDVKGFANVTWTDASDRFTFGTRIRYIGSMKDISTATNPASTIPGVDAVAYVDFNAGYKINENIKVTAGVINAFDRHPEATNGQVGLTDPNLYDRVGRRYFLTSHIKF